MFDLDLDLVSVCTPHPTHEDIVTRAAANGVNVLCEKPIAIDLGAAARMVTAAEAAGVRLGVIFQRRFWPAAQRIRRAIDDGTLGQPFLGHASVLLHRDPQYYTATPWRGKWATDGGGVLMTQAVHNIDLLQWFMGEAVEVSAAHSTIVQPIEVEDTAVATIRFAGGGLATLAASTALTPGLGTRVQVTGRSGATAGLAEYPEGSEARIDVWAVPGEAGRHRSVRRRADRRPRPGRDQQQSGAVPRAADRGFRRRCPGAAANPSSPVGRQPSRWPSSPPSMPRLRPAVPSSSTRCLCGAQWPQWVKLLACDDFRPAVGSTIRANRGWWMAFRTTTGGLN